MLHVRVARMPIRAPAVRVSVVSVALAVAVAIAACHAVDNKLKGEPCGQGGPDHPVSRLVAVGVRTVAVIVVVVAVVVAFCRRRATCSIGSRATCRDAGRRMLVIAVPAITCGGALVRGQRGKLLCLALRNGLYMLVLCGAMSA